jgi:enoyl-[acyl-carrier protein] reductase I
MFFLKGKKILVVGILSNKSIAYGIALAMHKAGAKLAFTYQSDKYYERISKLTQQFCPFLLVKCDVTIDYDIKNVFNQLKRSYDEIDSIVHSIAFSPTDQLKGDFIDSVTRRGFHITHDVSSYSFAAFAKEGRGMMKNKKSSLLTITYLGAERAVLNYNVMGVAKASLEATVKYSALSLGAENIRVNAISAGPVKTLAASGIIGFKTMLKNNELRSPLKRRVSLEEIGNVAVFLCSDMAAGVTGEIIHVDSGYHCVDMGIS